MLKKAASKSIKEQTDKLKDRLDSKLVEVEELIKAKNITAEEKPVEEAPENLVEQVQDH